jgi:outer membrane protein
MRFSSERTKHPNIMKSIVSLFLFSFFLLGTENAAAQKFGYVNSAQLIEAHPKVPGANTELETFRKSVMDPFEAKAKAFESKYMFFVEEVNAGTLSKVSAQTRQQELQKEQQELQTEQQQLEFSILQKREQLLQPILTEIDSIIQTFGKDNAYTMIFDTSVQGAILFTTESENLTEQIKAKFKS